jgi:type IV secretory pathway TrbD component
MNKNVGGIDRIVRILLGLALVAMGLYTQSWWGAVGLVPLITGLVGWCPMYLPFKVSTARSA